MKKSSVVSAVVLFVATMVLSGCIFPHWDNGRNRGRGHDGYRGEGHRGGGGGGRR